MPNEWRKDLEDVRPDSSPGADPENDDTDPGPGAGDQPGNGKSGRGIDELRGEMARKMGKLEGMVETLTNQLANQPATPPAPAPSGGNSLESLSVAELKDLFVKAENPAQQVYITDLIATKQARQIVGDHIAAYDGERMARERRQDSMRKAYDRYPELRDTKSSFYGAVMEAMESMGARANEPEALFNVANNLAFDFGIQPRSTRRDPGDGSGVAGGRTTRPVEQKETGGLSEEKFDTLHNGMRHALGEMTEEKKARIIARSKEYDKERNNPNTAFVKG